jgi:hypothetical protein
MTIDLFKCSFDMRSCDRYPTPILSNICEKFEQENTFISVLIDAVQPPFRCPVKIGVYNLTNTVSYEFPKLFSFIPFAGNVWVSAFKFVDRKTRKLKGCVNTEIKVLRKRVRN